MYGPNAYVNMHVPFAKKYWLMTALFWTHKQSAALDLRRLQRFLDKGIFLFRNFSIRFFFSRKCDMHISISIRPIHHNIIMQILILNLCMYISYPWIEKLRKRNINHQSYHLSQGYDEHCALIFLKSINEGKYSSDVSGCICC